MEWNKRFMLLNESRTLQEPFFAPHNISAWHGNSTEQPSCDNIYIMCMYEGDPDLLAGGEGGSGCWSDAACDALGPGSCETSLEQQRQKKTHWEASPISPSLFPPLFPKSPSDVQRLTHRVRTPLSFFGLPHWRLLFRNWTLNFKMSLILHPLYNVFASAPTHRLLEATLFHLAVLYIRHNLGMGVQMAPPILRE